jgi:hypothetical protein
MSTLGMEQIERTAQPISNVIDFDIINFDIACKLHEKIQILEQYIQDHETILSINSKKRAIDFLSQARFNIHKRLLTNNRLANIVTLSAAKNRITAAEGILGLPQTTEHIKIS